MDINIDPGALAGAIVNGFLQALSSFFDQMPAAFMDDLHSRRTSVRRHGSAPRVELFQNGPSHRYVEAIRGQGPDVTFIQSAFCGDRCY